MAYQTMVILEDRDLGKSATADLVLIEDKFPVFTGLLDEQGNRLYRLPDQHPLGFDLTLRKQG